MLWHQCLLAFAQHYKTEVTKEQKARLKTLLRVQAHPMITPEKALAGIDELELPGPVAEAFLAGNATRVFGI